MEGPALIRQTGGWTREEDNGPVTCIGNPKPDACVDVVERLVAWGRRYFKMEDASDEAVVEELGKDFGVSPEVFDWTRLRNVNLSEQVYDQFRRLADAHGAKLIIAAAPLSNIFERGSVGDKIDIFKRQLRDYHKAHPDVGIIEPVFWPDERFSSPVHVTTPSISANSIRFAEALAELVTPQTSQRAQNMSANRARLQTIVMDEEHPPAYGFGPAVKIDDRLYRGIREGRSEGLIFNRTSQTASFVSIDVAPDTPMNVMAGVSLTINGEVAEQISTPDPHSLRWRLPTGAQRYEGWMEILVSLRGRQTWPGDQLDADAQGPLFKIAAIRFE
jgi:hypothetical protein